MILNVFFTWLARRSVLLSGSAAEAVIWGSTATVSGERLISGYSSRTFNALMFSFCGKKGIFFVSDRYSNADR